MGIKGIATEIDRATVSDLKVFMVRIFAALLLSAIVITSISVWHYRRNKS